MAIHDHTWLDNPLVPWEPDNAPAYVIAVYTGGYTYKAVLTTLVGDYTHVGYADTPQGAILKALVEYNARP